jgi:adenosylcobinamide hydrolase
MDLQLRWRRDGNRHFPALVWRFPSPVRAISTAPHGGGLGPRRWVLNAQVPGSYARRDPDHHLRKLAVSLGLAGKGVGMMTAVDVRDYSIAHDGGVEVAVTVGLGHTVRAACAPGMTAMTPESLVGTINVVAFVPERLSDGALVNSVSTAAEAKAQALADMGLDGTGTPTDAVCLLCPEQGRSHAFGGPRSLWGARVARAVHGALLAHARAG